MKIAGKDKFLKTKHVHFLKDALHGLNKVRIHKIVKLDGNLFDGLQRYTISRVEHRDLGTFDVNFRKINHIGGVVFKEAFQCNSRDLDRFTPVLLADRYNEPPAIFVIYHGKVLRFVLAAYREMVFSEKAGFFDYLVSFRQCLNGVKVTANLVRNLVAI